MKRSPSLCGHNTTIHEKPKSVNHETIKIILQPFRKGVFLKEFALFLGENYFLLEKTTFQKGTEVQVSFLEITKVVSLSNNGGSYQGHRVSLAEKQHWNYLFNLVNQTYWNKKPGLWNEMSASVAQSDAHPTGNSRSWVQSRLGPAKFFCRDWSWNISYGHPLPSADSRKAVISFWWKNVHKY